MAQTRRRRPRKRRGTQSGRVDTRRYRGRPRSREEAKARARARRGGGKRRAPVDRRDRPPSWNGAVTRALVAAAIFLVSVLVLFRQPAAAAIPLAVLMMAIYIPLGYYLDRFFYRRRQAAKLRARQGR